MANLSNFIGLTRGDSFYRCEYDLQEIKAAAETDSYLRIAIKKYTELFFKSGYVLKGESDEAIAYLKNRFRMMSHMTDEAFDILLRETAYDLVKFANAFWIKTRLDKIPTIKATGMDNSGKPIAGYSRVDPSMMQIRFNEDGKVTGYKQITISGKEKIFKKDDVIHFTFDRDPGSEWGTPRWIATLEDIRILRKIEGAMLSLIYRYATPLYHGIVGLTTQGMGGTEKEVDDLRREIEHTPPDGMIITTERAQFKVVGAEGKALEVEPYLKYCENRVFSALNASQAMMGRGGSKQDADGMEEQVHNAVKDNQVAFSLQFQQNVINELLLEGGFNPIQNERDIVSLHFNEINLDTMVKAENHEITKFQANAITFPELRNNLGLKKDDVDTSLLYANMIQQANVMEQIRQNHENAVELAKLEAALLSSPDSSDSSDASDASSSGSSQYTKKNTGNGKTITTGNVNGSAKSIDSPQNQHGTFSAKIKESVSIDELSKSIQYDGSNLEDIRSKLTLLISDVSAKGSKDGYAKATEDFHPEGKADIPKLTPESDILDTFAKNNINHFLEDIKKTVGNTTDREPPEKFVKSQKYRMDFLKDFVYRKSYWYSYAKACSIYGIPEAEICGAEGSAHAKMHGKRINTSDFSISDIPAYSANCRCYLKPIKAAEEERKQ